MFTATAAQWLLQFSGFETVSSQSILFVENKASVVDLDCSGINSLWAGSVFFLLLSWLTRLVVDVRWWGLWLMLVALLLISNVVRIVALVVLDLEGMYGMAEIAHTSMSALGFTIAILLVWKFAQTQPKQEPVVSVPAGANESLSLRWPLVPVTTLLLAAAVIPSADNSLEQVPEISIVLPSALAARPIDLRDQEARFFKVSGARATKYQLGASEDNNSVVLVTSNWWKAQHKPDHCLQAMGFSIQNSRVMTVDDPQHDHIKAVTVLDLLDTDSRPYTAIYWFQAESAFTADHYRRMADTFVHPNRTWTMASLLLKGSAESDRILAHVEPITQAIDNSYLSTKAIDKSDKDNK